MSEKNCIGFLLGQAVRIMRLMSGTDSANEWRTLLITSPDAPRVTNSTALPAR
ncbi:hypothetical protein [Streptomyces sp. NPDC008125]|uniref:hypothetical protein n=1 Tax=Streptomyces sp. NPDC008125 TaxID=3364811 RepID=UPI0036E87CD2